jgi:branched-chain amino acid transport system substrate-binding protein
MRALACIATLLAGCSVALSFDECTVDTDCAGAPAYCTSDHLCVSEIPEERLCTELRGAPPGGDTIMLAGLFRLSGSSDDKDTQMADAARLAADELMQLNPIRPIGLVLCDTAGASDTALRALEQAIKRYHIVASIGPTTSSHVLSIVDVAVKSDVLVMSPSATSPAITAVEDANLIWRTCASDNLQAVVLAGLVPTMDPTIKVDVTSVETAYGTGLSKAFIAAWSEKSRVSPTPHVFQEGMDPTSVIAEIAADTPDYSVIVADADAAPLVGALYASDRMSPSSFAMGGAFASTQLFLFTDGAKGPALFGAMPDPTVLSKVEGTGPANPPLGTPEGGNFAQFSTGYKATFNSDPAGAAFVGNTYDAFYTVAMAVGGVASDTAVDGRALAEVIGRMSQKGAGVVNVGPNSYNTGVSALHGGGTIDLDGCSGPLDWDGATGDVITAPIEIWKVTGGAKPSFTTTGVVTP